jgi:hypothetical protein
MATWASATPATATVADGGLVTGVAEGTTVISATRNRSTSFSLVLRKQSGPQTNPPPTPEAAGRFDPQALGSGKCLVTRPVEPSHSVHPTRE